MGEREGEGEREREVEGLDGKGVYVGRILN